MMEPTVERKREGEHGSNTMDLVAAAVQPHQKP
jgi:hypothetical protein